MNICFYSPVWPLGSPPNGIATYVHNMHQALHKQGHTAFVLSAHSPVQSDCVVDIGCFGSSLHYRYSRLLNVVKKGYGPYVFETGKIKRALSAMNAKHNIDVLEIEESFGWSKVFSKHQNILAVTRLHGPHFLMMDWANKNTITDDDHQRIRREGEAIKTAPLITAPSQVVLNQTREFYNVDLKQAKVVANPVNIASDKDKWSLENCDRNTLLFVGRFDRIKGADLMLEAFGLLSSKYPELKLLFVGPDYGIKNQQGDNVDIHTYMNNCLSAQARSNVSYLGYQSPDQIALLRRQAFATVVCSRYESFGYNALEAMSFGSPLVSTQVGGLAEITQGGRTAVAVNEVNSEALAEGIETLLNNENLAQQLANHAYADCETYYSCAALAKKTVSIYQERL